MLVLSRKRGERIQVGDDVVLTVIDVKGNRVRLGFDAPRERRIMRTELTEERETRAEPTMGKGDRATDWHDLGCDEITPGR